MDLFEYEKVITESGNKEVILTTHRIRHEVSNWGHTHMVSIPLEKISSIEVRYSSWLILLLAGMVSLLMGAFVAGGDYNEQQAQALLIVGVVLIVVYILTRKHVITISSDGGAKINFATKGMNREMVMKFIDKVEEAKSMYGSKK